MVINEKLIGNIEKLFSNEKVEKSKLRNDRKKTCI